jgi:hypothetical protein
VPNKREEDVYCSMDLVQSLPQTLLDDRPHAFTNIVGHARKILSNIFVRPLTCLSEKLLVSDVAYPQTLGRGQMRTRHEVPGDPCFNARSLHDDLAAPGSADFPVSLYGNSHDWFFVPLMRVLQFLSYDNDAVAGDAVQDDPMVAPVKRGHASVVELHQVSWCP